MRTFLALMVGMIVSWSSEAKAESPTCWSSAVCYKGENTNTEWLKIFPQPNCTSKSNLLQISETVEYTRIQQKFNRSIAEFFKGLGSFAMNACSSCNSYQGIEVDGSSYTHMDAEECFAPVVFGVDGRTIADFIQIRPFPSCESGNKKPHETVGKMEILFDGSIEYVVKELQNFLFKNCNLCQTTKMKNAIATLSQSLWKPSTDKKQFYVPVICAEGDNAFENWMTFPDPNCKAANLTLLSEKPEKIFTSILERARAEIQDIVEEECRYWRNVKSPFSTSTSESEFTTTPETLQPGVVSGWQKMCNRRWYKHFTTKSSYQLANQACVGHQAQLAAEGMRDPEIRRKILDSFNFTSHTWIGLNDIATEGRFMWIDNVISTSTNTDWRPTQPDNWGGREDCGSIDANQKLNDWVCSEAEFYLCETEAIIQENW